MEPREKMGQLVEILRRWQKIENAAATQTATIMEESEHPLIRLVAEIIQRDTQMHHRVEQTIIDSQRREKITMSHADLEKVWSLISTHLQLERQTIKLARESLAVLKEGGGAVEHYLLTYLLHDEEKHEKLLTDLELMKNQLYPSG